MRSLSHDGVGNFRRRYGSFIPQEKGECAASWMVKLDGQACAVLVYGISKLSETSNQLIIMQAKLAIAAQTPLGINGSDFGNDQTEAAPGALFMIFDQPL